MLGVPVNTNVIPPVVNQVMEQSLRALAQQKKEMEQREVWRSDWKKVKSPTSPANLSDGGLYTPMSISNKSLFAPTPLSQAKFRPRGFGTEPKKTLPSMAALGRNASLTRTPEERVRTLGTQLIVRRESVKPMVLHLNSPKTTPAALPAETLALPPPVEIPKEMAPMATLARETIDSAYNASPSDDLASSSPGYDHYQRVIASGRESRDITPPVAKKPPKVPKLTKPGYEVYPSLEELNGMSEAQLATVENFTVVRPGYGKIEWVGAVDVSGLDLDDIVEISKNGRSSDIAVYDNVEQAEKPPVGHKLNRMAVLTFYAVFPKTGPGSSEEEIATNEEKLKKRAQKLGAEHLRYDGRLGEWKIRVQHFSRYSAVLDDESEDEGQAMILLSSKAAKRSALEERKPRKSTRFGLGDDDVSMSDAADMEDEAMEEQIYAKVSASALVAYREVFEYVHSEDVSENLRPLSGERPPVSFDEDGEDDSLVDIPTSPQSSPSESLMIAAALAPFHKAIARKCKVTTSSLDMGLRYGRTARACWLPNGSFLKLAKDLPTRQPVLVQCRPVCWGKGSVEPLKLLESQRSCSAQTGALFHLPKIEEDSDQSRNKVFRAVSEFSACSSENADASALFSLLASVISTDDWLSLVSECQVPPDSRLVAAATKMLSRATNVGGKIKEARRLRRLQGGIVAALTSGDIDLVSALAAEAGFFGLARVLATGEGGRTDLMMQILAAIETGQLSKMTPEIARFLRDIAGDAKFEDELFQNGDNSLDWRCRLAVRLLQEPDESLLSAMERYESDLRARKVPFPSTVYNSTADSGIRSAFYHLLRVSADSDSVPTWQVVDPRGFSSNPHDCALSFILASSLAAIYPGKAPLELFASEHLAEGFQAQLINSGYWEWAVFVCLCELAKDSHQDAKLARAKGIVLRFFNAEDPSSGPRRSFLESRIGVPTNWFEEALANRAAYAGDTARFIDHMLLIDSASALELIDEVYIPQVVFFEADDAILLKAGSASASHEDSLAFAIFTYRRLEGKVRDFVVASRQKGTEPAEVDRCAKLLKEASHIENIIFQRHQSLAPHSSLQPNAIPMIPLKDALAEALERLGEWKLQLESARGPSF